MSVTEFSAKKPIEGRKKGRAKYITVSKKLRIKVGFKVISSSIKIRPDSQ